MSEADNRTVRSYGDTDEIKITEMNSGFGSV